MSVKLKIAVDPGHNCPPDTGCAGLSPRYPTEDKLTKELADKVIQRLKERGHEVINCLPKGRVSSVIESLRARVVQANEAKVNLYVSLHFNCFNLKAHGTEVYAVSKKGTKLAEYIVNNIAKACGFKNRGVKKGSHLYVLKMTKAVAVLVEACFCDNEDDMNRYDADKVADAIVDGITAYINEEKSG
jgi:N-acetylmuramoyl-L-alanine amidase